MSPANIQMSCCGPTCTDGAANMTGLTAGLVVPSVKLHIELVTKIVML
jgi:hypothetical protein